MLKFIDARCQLGLPPIVKEGTPYTPEEILEVMDRCHIEKAIVHHNAAIRSSLAFGNEELVRITEGEPRFLRQWCAIPSHLGEFPEPVELAKQMKENHVTSLRLSPKTNGYSLRPYASGKLMDMVAQCHIPIFIDLETEIDPAGLYTLCQDYPAVNFVFCKPAYGMNRYLAGIFETCPNCYLGAGNYLVHGGIKLHCRYYGAEKLIFDTGLPDSSASSAVSLILYADISREEKELIAHGNIQRLLDAVTL